MCRIAKSIMMFAIFLMSLSGCSRESVNTDHALTIITLDRSVHFISPKDDDVLLVPGDYQVLAGEESLRLIPVNTKNTLLIKAEIGSENLEKVPKEAVVTSIPGADPDNADQHFILLVLPDGRQIVAEGNYSGIRPRGLLSKKDRQARQQKIMARVNAVATHLVSHIEQNLGMEQKNIPNYRAGNNAFREFDFNATGKAMKNTYLLAYLATLVYPDFLVEVDPNHSPRGLCENADCKNRIKQMHTNPQLFVNEYYRLTNQLFGEDTVEYTWLRGYEDKSIGNRGNLNYDPEAMVISTSNSVFVVFRGTDRVAETSYDDSKGKWGEWISTDLNALPQPPDSGLPGIVHYGFWNSLKAPTWVYTPNNNTQTKADGKFRDRLLAKIRSSGGDHKSIWVTGHSLGGGYSQLFAAFLAKNGMVARGVYTFESPQVGNREFVRYLNDTFKNRLQRFEFKSDPVTKLPIRFARAGARVFASNVHQVKFDAYNLRMPLPAVVVAESLCYHYPHWDLVATYNQLTAEQQRKMPSHLGTPLTKFQGCNAVNIGLGNGAG